MHHNLNSHSSTSIASRRVILAIDPGSIRTGYAFLASKVARPCLPRDFFVLDAGVLKISSELLYHQRLALLHEAVHKLILQHTPDVCVIEKAFSDKNISTAIKLGELRGAFICAAARASVPIAELTPAEVKKSIAGNGRAAKEQISRAVAALIGYRRGELSYDVTDALAIGLSFGLSLKHGVG